jgi:hypothetical protein
MAPWSEEQNSILDQWNYVARRDYFDKYQALYGFSIVGSYSARIIVIIIVIINRRF